MSIAPPRRVFLFCLSGLGPDTIEKLSTPQKPFINIDYFIKNGVSSNIMRPSYPTSQIVNQYSIATGLNPESNGIIGDKVYSSYY
jgi:predicted AlkP superfamily pyrophosphatase or phosphodiesterase